ncbi:MAG TPA: hypothetical protein VII33_17495 [Nakamurella sp.]
MRESVKIGLTVVGLVVVLAAAVTAGVLLWRPSFLSGPECTVPGDPADATAVPTVDLTVVQLQNASTINAVGLSRGIPERGRVIAVAAAYQESSLRNRQSGDRDSVGLFQQRPSQGWGTAEQIKDPIYASGRFYDALLDVGGWQDLPLTEVAQAVQVSAYPDAYAKWEPQATTLVRGLSGSVALQLTCSAGARQPTAEAPDRPAPAGTQDATPALTAALAAAQAELGGLTVSAVSQDGLTGTATASVPGLDPTAAGRCLAAWAVAHGIGMGVTEVEVQGNRWVDHGWGSAGPLADPAQVQITVAE